MQQFQEHVVEVTTTVTDIDVATLNGGKAWLSLHILTSHHYICVMFTFLLFLPIGALVFTVSAVQTSVYNNLAWLSQQQPQYIMD